MTVKPVSLEATLHPDLGHVLAARLTDREGDGFEMFVAGNAVTMIGPPPGHAFPRASGPARLPYSGGVPIAGHRPPNLGRPRNTAQGPYIVATVGVPPGSAVAELDWAGLWSAVKNVSAAISDTIGDGRGQVAHPGDAQSAAGDGTQADITIHL